MIEVALYIVIIIMLAVIVILLSRLMNDIDQLYDKAYIAQESANLAHRSAIEAQQKCNELVTVASKQKTCIETNWQAIKQIKEGRHVNDDMDGSDE